jgi:hypothetical protein
VKKLVLQALVSNSVISRIIGVIDYLTDHLDLFGLNNNVFNKKYKKKEFYLNDTITKK